MSNREMSSRDALEARVQSFVADLEKLVRQAVLEKLDDVRASLRAEGSSAEPSKLAAPKESSAKKSAAFGAGRKTPLASSSAAAAPGTSVPRKKGQKRSRDEILALRNQLEAFVTSNPGLRIEEISKKMGKETSELTRPMKQLVDAQKVRTEGVRRATRYFPPKKK